MHDGHGCRQSLTASSAASAQSRSASTRSLGRATFAATLLDLAPQSTVDRASVILAAVGSRRSLLSLDTAAAAGCLVVYNMAEYDVVELLSSLDEAGVEQLLVALATRARSEVLRNTAGGEPVLPSPSAVSASNAECLSTANVDLERVANDLAMGELDADATFSSAVTAIQSARARSANAAGSTSSYSPLPSVPITPLIAGSGGATMAASAEAGDASPLYSVDQMRTQSPRDSSASSGCGSQSLSNKPRQSSSAGGLSASGVGALCAASSPSLGEGGACLMQPLGGASTSQGTPAITRADGPGGDGQATASSAHASIINTAHGVTSKLDRIIEAALQSEEHHSASGAPPDPGSEVQELIAHARGALCHRR